MRKCDGCRERDDRIAELEARLRELERFQRETAYLRDEAKTDRDLRQLTGESQAMKAVRLAIQQVARTESTVLILGETGTGKELVARAIHQLSPRRDHLMVTVNCGALAPGIIASELFGHEPAHSRAPPAAGPDVLNWPTRERSSWTRSANYRLKRRSCCCASCRSVSSSAWAAT